MVLFSAFHNAVMFCLVYNVYLFSMVKDSYPYTKKTTEGMTMTAPEINQRFYVAFVVLVSLYLGIPFLISFFTHLFGCCRSHCSANFSCCALLKSLIVTAGVPFDLHFILFVILGGYEVEKWDKLMWNTNWPKPFINFFIYLCMIAFFSIVYSKRSDI